MLSVVCTNPISGSALVRSGLSASLPAFDRGSRLIRPMSRSATAACSRKVAPHSATQSRETLKGWAVMKGISEIGRGTSFVDVSAPIRKLSGKTVHGEEQARVDLTPCP